MILQKGCQEKGDHLSVPLREKCPYSEFSVPYFPALGLNTDRYSVSIRIQPKYGKIPTRKTSKTDTIYAVAYSLLTLHIMQLFTSSF